jgi:hypothetical protein
VAASRPPPLRRVRRQGLIIAPADAPHLASGIDIGGTFTDLILYEQDGGTYRSHSS